MFEKDKTPFVRWSAGCLPNGDAIKNLPVITLDEFLVNINDDSKHAPYSEKATQKIFHPGIMTTGHTTFIDIDHIEEYFDIITSKMEDIIAYCPMIILVKQSFSKSLHFICYGEWTNEDEYATLDMFYLACIAKAILHATGIDLRKVKDALDTHTKSSSQRLFVYNPVYHPIWFNPYIMAVTYDEKSFDEYPMLNPARFEQLPHISSEMIRFTGQFNPMQRTEDEKIVLDRNYEICGYTGNDARWRVANALFHVCRGDVKKAKQIIRDNFRNAKDFSFASAGKTVNNNVLNWVLKNLQSGGELTGGYLTDKMDEIIHYHRIHPRMLLVAPTGTGKTTLVNGTDKIIGLAKAINAVVVTPFNDMLHLYNHMVAIKSNDVYGANLTDYTSEEPVTIIWDQFIKPEILNKVIQDDRTVIVDESHTLFLDRDYRDSAVRLMNALKSIRKVICITATPTGEEHELGLDRLEYKTNKGIINTTFVHTDVNVGVSMLGDICLNERLGSYDRVVVFSDLYTRRLHEHLAVKGIDHAYIHSRNRRSEDFKELVESEMMTKRVTICTSLAFNGLNFRNRNERVLVLMDWHEGETLAANVIQCVGRMRESSVELKLYVCHAGERSTVDERKLKTDLLTDPEARIDKALVSFDDRLMNEEVVDALRYIEQYTNEHATEENLKHELGDTGYFIMRDLTKDNDGINGQLQLKEKRRIEEIWKDGFLSGTNIVDEDVISNEYFREVDYMWRKIASRYSIHADTVREILRNEKPDKLVSTTLGELEKKCIINCYTDEEYNHMITTLENILPKLAPIQQKQLKKDINCMKKWRESYTNFCNDERVIGNMVRLMAVEEEDIVTTIHEMYERRSKANSNPHKKHSNAKVYRCEDGFEGTKEELVEHTGKSLSTVKRLIKKEVYKSV